MSRFLDPEVWAAVPMQFWSLVFFVFGCIVGSFLNVCIYRMPRGENIVTPPSHCPHCGYSIPWYLNVPLVTWLYLRGRCANCRAPISVRYFLVELLTGFLFLLCWLNYHQTPWLALVYCLVIAGFIVATFIDFEHFIIPDEITLGGVVVGFLGSFAFPALHRKSSVMLSMKESFLGILVGAVVLYAILRLGKLMFGKQQLLFPPDTRIVFTETKLQLPDKDIPYEELFYRKSDFVLLEAKQLELPDRCYKNATVRLTPDVLQIDEENISPEEVTYMEIVTDKIVLPREAMGLGDVKFMAAIGAFLGWQAVLFSLMFSSVIGALVGVGLILFKKQAWSSRIPYGPYIALAATFWIFGGRRLLEWWLVR
jgi:leader peptidase (prepilin peptidase)/N-methyltransferase